MYSIRNDSNSLFHEIDLVNNNNNNINKNRTIYLFFLPGVRKVQMPREKRFASTYLCRSWSRIPVHVRTSGHRAEKPVHRHQVRISVGLCSSCIFSQSSPLWCNPGWFNFTPLPVESGLLGHSCIDKLGQNKDSEEGVFLVYRRPLLGMFQIVVCFLWFTHSLGRTW